MTLGMVSAGGVWVRRQSGVVGRSPRSGRHHAPTTSWGTRVRASVVVAAAMVVVCMCDTAQVGAASMPLLLLVMQMLLLRCQVGGMPIPMWLLLLLLLRQVRVVVPRVREAKGRYLTLLPLLLLEHLLLLLVLLVLLVLHIVVVVEVHAGEPVVHFNVHLLLRPPCSACASSYPAGSRTLGRNTGISGTVGTTSSSRGHRKGRSAAAVVVTTVQVVTAVVRRSCRRFAG
jgi:hypothetical protein